MTQKAITWAFQRTEERLISHWKRRVRRFSRLLTHVRPTSDLFHFDRGRCRRKKRERQGPHDNAINAANACAQTRIRIEGSQRDSLQEGSRVPAAVVAAASALASRPAVPQYLIESASPSAVSTLLKLQDDGAALCPSPSTPADLSVFRSSFSPSFSASLARTRAWAQAASCGIM